MFTKRRRETTAPSPDPHHRRDPTKLRAAMPPAPGATPASSNNTALDDDDLELPVVTAKPLSSAASLAKFHKLGVTSDRTRRPHASATAAAVAHHQHHRHPQITKLPPSPPRSGAADPWRTPSKPGAHARVRYHTGTSAKQQQRRNRLSSFVLHSVTPREAYALSSNGFPGSHTEYMVVVENIRTSQIWQVSRRFSTFVYLRKELTALFDAPHCHYCTEMHMKLDALHDDFPSRRLWGSNKPSIVKQRAQRLQEYLVGLLELGARSHKKSCKLVASDFSLHLRSFLTVEAIRFNGIPGGDFGHSIPSLLQELSMGSSTATVAKRVPLATILEHVPASHNALIGLALLEDEGETEDEDDTVSTSDGDNQRDDRGLS